MIKRVVDDLRDVQQNIRRLWQEVRMRPLRVKGGGAATGVYTLAIVDGNTLSDGSTLGIVYESGGVYTVPAIYDPNAVGPFSAIDGIGRATLYINGIAQTGYVLVVHDGGSGAITNALFAGDLCLSSANTVSIPLDTDPTQTITAYRPYTP
jgi:hypothetical protein